ncbi:uncharacterized protein LOC113863920 [Abrus precatorius]|uniref:Uncharacterized protein LOC113863920 n=1 Tax=Abrus precatorius TaxID=3816 RepID=A0A8B8LB94_ABRPR|nr:uncharacterized protein LOC113863920 [Abrus precatorius]
MVRKSNVARNNDKPHVERAETQLSSGNIKLPGALESRLEIPLPRFSSPTHQNFLVDGVETRNDKSQAQDQVNQASERKKSAMLSKRKKSKHHGGFVRRSERIKSAFVNDPNSNHGIEYIEDETISESEKDEPGTQMEQVLAEAELEPEPADVFGEKTLDEKVDYALQRIEALDKIVALLQSKVDENIGFDEAPSMASMSYRSMYINSQKKIEALTDENQQLNGKLQNALGKIEVYEKENRVLIDVLDKTKDAVNAVLVSNLVKTTEAAVNASTQAIQNACTTSATKRKRSEN